MSKFHCLLYCITLFTVTTVGCGSSTEPGTAAAATPRFQRVGPTPESHDLAKARLVGTWTGRIEVLSRGVEQKRASLTSDIQRTKFDASISRFQTTKMTLALHDDQTMKMEVSTSADGREVAQPSEGRWKIVGVDGNSVEVEFLRDDRYRESQQFLFQSKDGFVAAGPGGAEFAEVARIHFERLR